MQAESKQQQPSEPILVRYRNRNRNRDLRATDLAFIQTTMQAHPGLGRTPLSRLLCELWNWRMPCGGLKEYACRDLLLRLEEWGHLTLPPRQSRNGQKKRISRDEGPSLGLDLEPHLIESGDLSQLIVRPVRDRQERLKWRALMDRYHYLGEGVMCGSHILYVATLPGPQGNEEIVACLGWGAASLRNPKRDAWLGVDFEHLRKRLHLVVNNQRFLILPWVRIKNLGSRVLSLNFKRLSADWESRYGHGVACVETFVDVSRFQGTVYKAANWRQLGLTAGRSKRGNGLAHTPGQAKAIFVYPPKLTRAQARLLTSK